MKSAEECLDMIAAAYNCPDVAITETIRLIQLDAMKEGMRRAAEQVGGHWNDKSTHTNQWQQAERSKQSILTAAEQLTEKDL